MASLAKHLTGVDRSVPFATQDVLAVRHHLKVVWVHAMANPAQVVQDETLWDFPDHEFVEDTMSNRALLIDTDRGVALGCPCAGPEPTLSVQVDARLDPIEQVLHAYPLSEVLDDLLSGRLLDVAVDEFQIGGVDVWARLATAAVAE